MAYQVNVALGLVAGNVKGIVDDIRRQLKSGLSVDVNVNISPNAISSIQQLNTQFQQLNTIIQQTNLNAAGLSTSIGRIASVAPQATTNIANTTAASKSLAGSLQATSAAATEATTLIERLGQQSGLAARRFLAFALTAGPFLALISSIKSGISEAVEFQRELIKLDQIGGNVNNTVKEISDEVSRLATTFGVSSRELIQSAVALTQMGNTAERTAIELRTLAQAALSPNFGTAEQNVEGLNTVMSIFKIRAEDAQRAFSQINAIANRTGTSASEFFNAIRAGGEVFQATGGTFQEFIANIGTIRQTLREGGGEIGAGLKVIFQRIQTDNVVNALSELQIHIRRTAAEANALGNSNLTGQFVGQAEAIRRISEGIRRIPANSPERAALETAIGGSRQIQRVQALTAQPEQLQRNIDLVNAGGSSLDISTEKAMESLLNRTKQVGEEFKQLFRTIGDSKELQTLAGIFLNVSSALAKVLELGKPLLPLLTALATVKIGQAVGGVFGRGFEQVFSGGQRPRYLSAGGYIVPGAGNQDSVPAMLMPGEFVLNKQATEKIGRGNLDSENYKGFDTGGRVEYGGQLREVGRDVGNGIDSLASYSKNKGIQYYKFLEQRYGKTQAKLILASGQAVGWGITAVSSALGNPLYIPGSTFFGQLPAVGVAELALQTKRGIGKLLGKSGVPALLTPGERVFSQDEVNDLGGGNLERANITGNVDNLRKYNKGGFVTRALGGGGASEFEERLLREALEKNNPPYNFAPAYYRPEGLRNPTIDRSLLPIFNPRANRYVDPNTNLFTGAPASIPFQAPQPYYPPQFSLSSAQFTTGTYPVQRTHEDIVDDSSSSYQERIRAATALTLRQYPLPQGNPLVNYATAASSTRPGLNNSLSLARIPNQAVTSTNVADPDLVTVPLGSNTNIPPNIGRNDKSIGVLAENLATFGKSADLTTKQFTDLLNTINQAAKASELGNKFLTGFASAIVKVGEDSQGTTVKFAGFRNLKDNIGVRPITDEGFAARINDVTQSKFAERQRLNNFGESRPLALELENRSVRGLNYNGPNYVGNLQVGATSNNPLLQPSGLASFYAQQIKQQSPEIYNDTKARIATVEGKILEYALKIQQLKQVEIQIETNRATIKNQTLSIEQRATASLELPLLLSRQRELSQQTVINRGGRSGNEVLSVGEGQPSNTGFFGRLLGRGASQENSFARIQAASLALPYANEYLVKPFEPNVQDAAVGRSTTGFYTSRGIGGAITGGTIGAVVGSQFAAVGGPAGAAIGATIGIVEALNNAKKEIDRVQIENSFRNFGKALDTAVTQLERTGRIGTQESADLNTNRREAFQTALNQSTDTIAGRGGGLPGFLDDLFDTHPIGGPSQNTIDSRQRLQIRTTQILNRPENVNSSSFNIEGIRRQDAGVANYIQNLQRQSEPLLPTIERQIRLTATQAIRRNPNVSSTDLFNNLLNNPDSGLSRQYLLASGQSENYYRNTRLPEQVAQIRSGIAGENAQLGQARLYTNLNSLAAVVEGVVNGLKYFGDTLSNVSAVAHGSIGVSRLALVPARDQFGSAQFNQTVEGVTSGFGPAGQQLNEYGSVAGTLAQVLPDALRQVYQDRETNLTGNTNVPQRLGTRLYSALGTTELNASQAQRDLVGQITNGLAQRGGEGIRTSSRDVGGTARGLSDTFLRPIGDVISRLQNAEETYQNLRISGQNEFNRLLIASVSNFYQASQVQLQTTRTSTGFELGSQGRNPAFVADYISLQTANQPFVNRENTLLQGTGLQSGATPQEIGQRLASVTAETQRLTVLRNQPNLPIQQRIQVTDQLEVLNSQAARYTQVLQNMTNASERNAFILERLNNIRQDEESRTSFAKNYLTAEPEQQAEITRGVQLALQAQRQGSVTGFAQEEQQLIFRSLGSLNNTSLASPTGGRIRASELSNQLANEAFFGSQNVLSPDVARDQTFLQSQVIENLNRATGAFEVLGQNQVNAATTILEGLQTLQNDFFSRLESNLNAQGNRIQAEGAANARNQAVAGFATGGQARGTDIVPAMLTPGEFIVNRDSAQSNIGLLNHINERRGPVYMAEGGFLRPDEIVANIYGSNDETRRRPEELIADAYGSNVPGARPDIASLNAVGGTYNPRNPALDYQQQVEQSAAADARVQQQARLANTPLRQIERQRAADEAARPAREAAEREATLRQSQDRLINFANGGGNDFGAATRQLFGYLQDNQNISNAGSRYYSDASSNLRRRQVLAQSNISGTFGGVAGGQAGATQRGLLGQGLQESSEIAARISTQTLPRSQRLQNPNAPAWAEVNGVRNDEDPNQPRLSRNSAFNALRGYATGGVVDNIPAMLSQGEYVLNQGATNRIGVGNLNRMNYFADGGFVGDETKGLVGRVRDNGQNAQQDNAGLIAALNSGFTSFDGSSKSLIDAFNKFSQSSGDLTEALSKFPSSLTIEGKQTVEVLLNGGEVLSRIMPEVKGMIEEQTKQTLQKTFKDKFPDINFSD